MQDQRVYLSVSFNLVLDFVLLGVKQQEERTALKHKKSYNGIAASHSAAATATAVSQTPPRHAS